MEKAYVLLTCNTGSEDSIINQLSTVSYVSDVHGTFGPYDIIVKLESKSEDEIQNSISNKIRKVSSVRSTLTLFVHEDDEIYKVDKSEEEILENYLAQAYVIIHCSKSSKTNVLERLASIPSVTEGASLVGSYQTICKIMAPTYNDISDIITKQIRKISDISSTMTLNIVPNQ